MASKDKWLSKVKHCLACGGEDLSNESDKRTGKGRRKGQRKLNRGERNSFVSLFKEPTSSIEKILEDAETEQGLTCRTSSLEQPKKASVMLPKASTSFSISISPRVVSPKAATSRIPSPRSGSLRVVIPRAPSIIALSPAAGSHGASPKVPSPVAVSPKACSVKSASAGVVPPVDASPIPRPPSSRRSKVNHREESISRMEPVFPYHHVSATKMQADYTGHMMLDQEQCLSDKQPKSTASDAGKNKDWGDNILSKEEREARNKRKVDAVTKKGRSMTFLQSHQKSKFTSESAASSALMDLRIDGLPRHHQSTKKGSLTSPKSGTPRSPRLSMALRGSQYLTTRNSQLQTPSRFSQVQTPGTPRSHYSSGSLLTKYSKPAPSDINFTDTVSLSSCPAYSVPRYMLPTASARAKMRLSNNFKDISSPSIESKRRLSYPLTPCSGISRGTLFTESDASSQRTVRTNRSSRSISNLLESTRGSVTDGRKPFNRFV